MQPHTLGQRLHLYTMKLECVLSPWRQKPFMKKCIVVETPSPLKIEVTVVTLASKCGVTAVVLWQYSACEPYQVLD